MHDGRFDLVLHEATSPGPIGKRETPPSTDVEFAPGLFVAILPRDCAALIFELCTPRDLVNGSVLTASQAWTQRYAVLRRRVDDTAGWDNGRELQCAIALSRLVRPTPICLQYAATIRIASGVTTWVTPANPIGVGRGAWVSDPTERDFLTEQEWRQVGDLVEALPFSTQGERWKRAMWFLEYAFRTHEGTVRWTLLATALEALVHTSRLNSTRQFVNRTVSLARQLGIEGWDEGCASLAYDVRSGLAHGRSAESLSEEDETRVNSLMERLLRELLLAAVVAPSVGNMLRCDADLEMLGMTKTGLRGGRGR